MYRSAQKLHLDIPCIFVNCLNEFLVYIKVKVLYLCSDARSTGTYLQNILQLPPSRATPPNLGEKISGKSQHNHAGWCFTWLPHSAIASFTPECGEAHMEFTSCLRMLHSQPTGSISRHVMQFPKNKNLNELIPTPTHSLGFCKNKLSVQTQTNLTIPQNLVIWLPRPSRWGLPKMHFLLRYGHLMQFVKKKILELTLLSLTPRQWRLGIVIFLSSSFPTKTVFVKYLHPARVSMSYRLFKSWSVGKQVHGTCADLAKYYNSWKFVSGDIGTDIITTHSKQ